MRPDDYIKEKHSNSSQGNESDFYRMIELHDQISELEPMATWVNQICEELHISEVHCMNINLVLEEAVVNVVSYAYPDKTQQHLFWVECEINKDKYSTWRIIDKGVPFDPTQQEEADITLNAEDRPIGGLGIFMIRQIADSVSYERKDDQNIFTIEMDLSKEPLPE